MSKWEITEDLIAERSKDSDVGVRSPDGTRFEGPTFDFRIRDDDGNVYYRGKYDKGAWEALGYEPGNIHHALQWAARNAGATDLQIRTRDASAFGMDLQGEDGWVSLF